jgi:hypothetical protein
MPGNIASGSPRGTGTNGNGPNPILSQSRVYEQKTAPASHVKTPPGGARTMEKNFSNREDIINRRTESAPHQTGPRVETFRRQAAEPLTKVEPEGAREAMDGNPYETELESLLQKQQRQAEKLEKMGRCLECGKKLSFFAKLWGLKFCRKHGF